MRSPEPPPWALTSLRQRATAASQEKVKTNVYLTNYIKTDNHTV